MDGHGTLNTEVDDGLEVQFVPTIPRNRKFLESIQENSEY